MCNNFVLFFTFVFERAAADPAPDTDGRLTRSLLARGAVLLYLLDLVSFYERKPPEKRRLEQAQRNSSASCSNRHRQCQQVCPPVIVDTVPGTRTGLPPMDFAITAWEARQRDRHHPVAPSETVRRFRRGAPGTPLREWDSFGFFYYYCYYLFCGLVYCRNGRRAEASEFSAEPEDGEP